MPMWLMLLVLTLWQSIRRMRRPAELGQPAPFLLPSPSAPQYPSHPLPQRSELAISHHPEEAVLASAVARSRQLHADAPKRMKLTSLLIPYSLRTRRKSELLSNLELLLSRKQIESLMTQKRILLG